jgi:ribonucleoside-triphosphate reductase
MLTKIKKRDGRIVPFDEEKIANAIFKAARAVGGQDYERAKYLAGQVVKTLEGKYSVLIPSVEDVQDIVEKVLIENGHAKTAKAYILYRQQHAEIRNFQNLLINSGRLIQDYITEKTWEVKENSNMNFSLQGLNNHMVSAMSKKYWLEKIYPPKIKEAHEYGDFHIHDLGLLSPYCCGWDLADLLTEGFKGAPQKIESASPKHFRSALGQIVNFFYTLQGEAAGAQALANFDTYLAPFIRYDGLTYTEVKQAIQEFVFNLNVPTRVGFQTPFVNLTFDVQVPAHMKKEPVIFGGQRMFYDPPYEDYQNEMNMINKAFCEVMSQGDAKGRIFTFPIPTYNITEEFFDSAVCGNIMEMTAKYGTPYFANFINSDLSPEQVRSMCCRLRLDVRELRRKGGGLFGANPLTGSIGVVTLNLPRIGYKSKNEQDFFDRLTSLAELARDSLLIKRRIIEQMTELGLYPYSKYFLRIVRERFGQYWANHFNTIGIIGMNEALLNFMGKDIGTPEGRTFALKVMDHLRSLLVRFQEETGQMFNLEATPAEGTSYRLAKIDRELYPDIVTAGKDTPYYTNSTQLPVNYTDDIFEALDLQDELQTKYTGGTVLHMFVGEHIEDTAALKELMKRIFTQYRLPYLSFTPTFSVCPDHGYIAGEYFKCPYCGKDSEVWSRIVGYYRPVQNWNKGKQEEYYERITYSL